MIKRKFVSVLYQRVKELSPLIQVLLGPRQVGKTTGVKQLLSEYEGESLYVTADNTLEVENTWILEQWQKAKRKSPQCLLIIDEIQKIHNWSEAVKKLWDLETENNRLKVILLGSSSFNLQKGLTESLAGRFELIRVYHWSYLESKEAFGYSLDEYLIYGGYPGADRFKNDFDRWFQYLKTSMVDVVIGQDILHHQTVSKPALFRQAFNILCGYPSREVSYTTLLGQLQDKGNTDLIKHYLELYESAFMFIPLSKYSKRITKTKSSSPKIIPGCPALFTLAKGNLSLNLENKGFLFEAIVGYDLIQHFLDSTYYWRDKTNEVDFIVEIFDELFAIEVKSGRKKSSKGLTKFCEQYTNAKPVILTLENYEDFCADPKDFLRSI